MAVLNDVERVARAKELRPGRMAGPWEFGYCDHGKRYSFRWTWRKDASIEDGEPEIGSRKCKRCNPPENNDR